MTIGVPITGTVIGNHVILPGEQRFPVGTDGVCPLFALPHSPLISHGFGLGRSGTGPMIGGLGLGLIGLGLGLITGSSDI